jgi:hypothetical protein
MAPRPDLQSVWGALVEIGLNRGSATIVSLADGTTSMYTSTGGGVIGAGAHDGPARASRSLLVEIEKHLDLFPPADTCPLPGREAVSFVVLTFDGLRRAESDTQRLADPAEPLHAIWMAANVVMTEIRLRDAFRESGKGAGGGTIAAEPGERPRGLKKLFRRGN